MRVYDYKPKGFKGSVKIQIPNYKQRLNYVKESGFEIGETVSLKNNIDALLVLIDVAEKHIKEINLEKGRESIKSWEELLDSDHNDIIQQIALMMVLGGGLGEA